MNFIQCMRWYGPRDPVSLSYLKQAGATGVVSALHHIPVGEVWPVEDIQHRKSAIEEAGLSWEVVESVNVHESIKTGDGQRERYLENYRITLQNLAASGLKTVCYNFMPVLDWTRTDLNYPTATGSETLRYDHLALVAYDVFQLQRPGAVHDYEESSLENAETYWKSLDLRHQQMLERNILAGIPGYEEQFTPEVFLTKLEQYKDIDRDSLKENLRYFIGEVMPVAQKSDINLGIHPDDPPYPLFGLPRIMGCLEDFEFLLSCSPHPQNGITFCTGSLGPRPENDLPGMIRKLGQRIHFVHLRSIKRQEGGSFYEADHLDGDVDMVEVMLALMEEMADRAASSQKIPMRPDHGPRMLDDLQKPMRFPGYSAIGRLKGLAELRGLETALARVRVMKNLQL